MAAPKNKDVEPPGRVHLGFRVTPEMKRRVEKAAKDSGRSQSQEAEFRLEQSFQQEDLLSNALTLKYGKKTAGFILLVANAISRAGNIAEYSAYSLDGKASSAHAPGDWVENNAFAYDQAAKAAICVIEAVRPHGDPELPIPADHPYRTIWRAMAKLALKDTAAVRNAPSDEAIGALLGSTITMRIRERIEDQGP